MIKDAPRSAIVAAILAAGFLAILIELYLLSLQPRVAAALPIGASELWRLFSGSIFAWGPFALLMLASMRVRGAFRMAVWVGAVALLTLSLFAIHGAWTEVEDPGAASIGAGFVVTLAWLASILASAMLFIGTMRGRPA